MPCPTNRVIVACAGSGKTTRLVERALEDHPRRVAMITYTNNNAREILSRFCELRSGVPTHVDVMTWFGFLLRECARPYQRSKYNEPPIEGLTFVNKRSTPYVKEADTARYYTSLSGGIYSDKISRFVVECEQNSGGAVTRRLERIYSPILIDEFQDLAGWDLEVVRALLETGVEITLVGDPRQHIYSTNPAKKNEQYLGAKVLGLLEKWEKAELCTVESLNTTYRCPQEVCEFANRLWPGMPEMTSAVAASGDHVGAYLVPEDSVHDYLEVVRPQVLRHDRRSKDYGADALNFGLAKGLQFQDVMIVPTGPIRKFLKAGEVDAVMKARDKLHVAVTRAQRSVAFAYNGPSSIVAKTWPPEA